MWPRSPVGLVIAEGKVTGVIDPTLSTDAVVALCERLIAAALPMLDSVPTHTDNHPIEEFIP